MPKTVGQKTFSARCSCGAALLTSARVPWPTSRPLRCRGEGVHRGTGEPEEFPWEDWKPVNGQSRRRGGLYYILLWVYAFFVYCARRDDSPAPRVEHVQKTHGIWPWAGFVRLPRPSREVTGDIKRRRGRTTCIVRDHVEQKYVYASNDNARNDVRTAGARPPPRRLRSETPRRLQNVPRNVPSDRTKNGFRTVVRGFYLVCTSRMPRRHWILREFINIGFGDLSFSRITL